MPRLFYLTLLYLSGWTTYALAQDTTLVLDTTLLNSIQVINLSQMDGWVYASGHNPAWSKPTVNTGNWRRFKPADISSKDAGRNGKVEGWFRLKIKLDSTWKGLDVGLRNHTWAATDVYIDGQPVASFGSTGTSGKPYREHSYYGVPTKPIQLKTGLVHLLAIHLVDYVSPFPRYPGRRLQSEFPFKPTRMVQLTGPRHQAMSLDNLRQEVGYRTLWFGIALFICISFWLLSLVNLYEKKILRLIAVNATFAAISQLCRLLTEGHSSFRVTYEEYCGLTLSLWLTIVFSLLSLMAIFGYRINRRWYFLSISLALAGGTLDLYIGGDIVISIANILQQFIILYLLISSWKRLQGAQWAIVIGALVSVLTATVFAALDFANVFFNSNLVYTTFNLLFSVISFASPISFLFYIALRLKEILAEVRTKATEVVQVTEEKRAILATQNQLLEQQVEARTAELKASQNQLIQKEKLASLGELTAGIAHEIQNPLNFVNNFSEVSGELVDELTQEAQAGHTKDVLAIADDLRANLHKIHHHGGRASSIVKGMLEHSRTVGGDKEPANINALCEEYFKLAHHGQRAKDNALTCELVTHFDHAIGQIKLIPQEIGRVLLNLFSNAFYAVRERQQRDESSYQPTVTVTTVKTQEGAQIRIADNGMGMSESVQAKIFQPFFTTKPTGEGTGLGLSLSYDIITKGHGGLLQVESQEGKGTEFVMSLPD